jgi:Protein of unknown function (DUF2914)
MFAFQQTIAWRHALKAYERHISAAAMAGGFAFDNVSYGRLDHPVTQTLLLVYLVVSAGSIVILHYLEAHPEWQGAYVSKLRGYLPAVTQFVFGSLWSAFLVFYWRSGVLVASWPFLLVLAAIFIGNEVFRIYHARLIFTSVLFFFALMSYAIFMVPVFTHTIGTLTFLLSGAAAALVFVGFLWGLNALGTARLGEVRWKIASGALAVFAVVNILYFLNVLPPLPLALQKSGVFHSICRIDPGRHSGQVRCVGQSEPNGTVARAGQVYYEAMGERPSWLADLGVPQVIHVQRNAPVIVFSAVFAPIRLSTTTTHVWQRYDDAKGQWVTWQRVTYSIQGGRAQGYRGYSVKTNPAPGLWRVDIESEDGRLIGRTLFTVVNGPVTAPEVSVRL